MTALRIHPLLRTGLFPILDITLTPPGEPLASVVEQFLEADHDFFIVRQPTFSQEKMARHVQTLTELAEFMDFQFIVHHHTELCDAPGVMGVHLTVRSPRVGDIRRTHAKDFLIGYSAHSLDEALQAQNNGADYIFLGAIYPTPKPDPEHPVLGTEVLRATCARLEIPVYAIGGIDENNITQTKQAGATGFCSLRALYSDGTIEHNAAKLGFVWEDA
jgi:thiamine-phosphate pyrophosphorylase